MQWVHEANCLSVWDLQQAKAHDNLTPRLETFVAPAIGINATFLIESRSYPRSANSIYGPCTTCYNRFVRWRRAGVWGRIVDFTCCRSTLADRAMGADRSTQHMPLRTRRSSTRGTPRALFGNIGGEWNVTARSSKTSRSASVAGIALAYRRGLCDQYISGPEDRRGPDRQAPRRPRSSGSST